MHPQQQRRIAGRIGAAGDRVDALDVFMDPAHPGRGLLRGRPFAEADRRDVRGGGGQPADRIPPPAAVLVDASHRQRMQRLRQQRPQAGHPATPGRCSPAMRRCQGQRSRRQRGRPARWTRRQPPSVRPGQRRSRRDPWSRYRRWHGPGRRLTAGAGDDSQGHTSHATHRGWPAGRPGSRGVQVGSPVRAATWAGGIGKTGCHAPDGRCRPRKARGTGLP